MKNEINFISAAWVTAVLIRGIQSWKRLFLSAVRCLCLQPIQIYNKYKNLRDQRTKKQGNKGTAKKF